MVLPGTTSAHVSMEKFISRVHRPYLLLYFFYNTYIMPFKMDPSKSGFNMFFKPYQVEALRVLQNRGEEGANSRMVWQTINETLPSPISRASIINSLNMMVDEGVLQFTEVTGKGGHQRVYRLDMTESVQ